MDGEIQNFIKVWFLAATALSYCYYVVSTLPKGIPRLLSILPVLYLLAVLPLELRSFHLGGSTAFFLVWLANFNLLLFSSGRGPLSPPPPRLLHFIALACLPVKLKHPQRSPDPPSRSVLLPLKAALMVLLFQIYDYKEYLHPYVVLGLYCVHVYLEAELMLVLCGSPARAFLSLELEPQFNEPYLSTSLQDFWGRRWNLVVTGLLRPTVYKPVRHVTTPEVAVLATFVVSALMHEALYYYITRASPTWEVTCFFVLHGICTAVEVVVKRRLKGRWRLHRAVSGLLTVAFVAATGVWLFLPQLTRNGMDEKAIGEYKVLVSSIGRVTQNVQLQLKYLYYWVCR